MRIQDTSNRIARKIVTKLEIALYREVRQSVDRPKAEILFAHPREACRIIIIDDTSVFVNLLESGFTLRGQFNKAAPYA